MLNLDYDAVHRFEKTYPNASWEGHDLMLFKPNPAGYTNMRGAFRDGQWGILTRVSPDNHGRWKFGV